MWTYDLLELFCSFAFLDVQTSIICALMCLFWIYILLRKPSGLPPGPSWRAPLLGHLRVFTRSPNIRQVLNKYRQRYGDVYSLYLGRRLVVIVNGLDAIKEAFVSRKDTFSYHPNTVVQQARSSTYGFDDTNDNRSETWSITTLDTLKSYGLDIAAIETTISKEINRLLEEMNTYHDKVLNPKQVLTASVVNANYSVTLGTDYSYTDPEFKRLLSLTRRCVTAANTSGLLNFLPFLRHLPGDFFRFNEFKQMTRTLNRYFDFRFEACREYLKDGCGTSVASTYQRAIEECTQNHDKKTQFSDIKLKTVLSDILGTGSEHTAGTLCCAIRFLADNPDIQDRVFKEIVTFVDDKRRPCLADKARLTYTSAFLEETLRMSNLIVLGPPHTTEEDVYLGGYWIPRGSVIFPDVHTVMFDPTLWEQPEVFRPERFLASQTSLLSELSASMPFFVGQRYTLGYQLSSMELFLYMTSLIQTFEFDHLTIYDAGVNKAGRKSEAEPTPHSSNFSVRMRNRKRQEDWESI